MDIGILTLLLFGSLAICLILGLPLAFSFGGVGVIFILLLMGPKGLYIVACTAFDGWTNYLLLAIPLYILMAIFIESSGIAEELYDAMYKWIGGLKGGLAIGTVVICAIFAAMTGTGSLGTITMGLVALPSMLKRGYDKHMCMGCIAAGGTLGIIIPPSIIMVVYGAFAGQSIGALFIGGIIPGILLSLIFMAYIAIRSYLQPNLCPALEEKFSLRERLVALRSLILPILLIFLVLGIIWTGAATPTEAAGVGASGAFLILIVSKRLRWTVLKDTVSRTLLITCMSFWIVLGAKCFTHVYIAIGAIDLVQGFISGFALNRWLVMITTQLILLVLGCFLDPLGILLITAPVFVPVIINLGFDPIWFGVLFTVSMEMAFITPPFGFNLFYMKTLVEPLGFSLEDVYRAIVPFVILEALGIAIVMLFPQLALWLPSTMMGR